MNSSRNSLFVGDLPKYCTESDLAIIFDAYQPILEIKIKRNDQTGKTLSYGFVTFISEEVASRALRNIDGALFCGRKLR